MSKKKVRKIDNRYILLALAGAILIGALMLLNMTFSEYMRFRNDGYAVLSGTVSDSLGKNPEDEGIEKEVSLHKFLAQEHLFKQEERLFIGEKKKEQVDANFPVYLNRGDTMQLVNDSAVLIDNEFQEIATYQGMMISNGYSYNVDGSQADAAQYVFLKFANGNFSNLATISYEKKAEKREIPQNSLVHFGEDFFSYYVLDGDSMEYRYCLEVTDDFPIMVGEKEYTYLELLYALGIKRETEEIVINTPDSDEEEEIEIPEVELDESEQEEEEAGKNTIETQKAGEEQERKNKDQKSTKNNGNKNPGVRPDSMREDKNKDDETEVKEPVIGYVKPEVRLGEFEAKVYRIVTDLEVKDPASRIHKTKQVQFEVYKVDEKGKETLQMRSYNMTTGEVTLGNGMVEPGTTYHIIAYYTYYNEFDEVVEEALGEQTVTTKGLDTLEPIHLVYQNGTSYNNRAELTGFSYGAGSDTEAVYGISNSDGIRIEYKTTVGKSATILDLNGGEINKFKRNSALTLTTLPVLKAKTTYNYNIEVQDYFGNKLEVTNATGSVTTCSNTPVANLKINKNKIGSFVMEMSVQDEDATGVLSAVNEGMCDIYVAVATERDAITDVQDLDKEEVVYHYRLEPGEYTYSAQKGIEVSKLELPEITNLKLDKKYYATVYCDYDLQNGKGIQRFAKIGEMNFTSAGLSSLGKVYVNCDITNITYHSADINFALNLKATNEQLVNIIKEVRIDVTAEGAEAPVATVGFGPEDKVEDTFVYENFRNGGWVGYTADDLNSMTNYDLTLTVKAEYEGEEVTLISVLDTTTFLTMRKPAEVKVDNLLFAAGTLYFDAYVDDPDGAVTGNSGNRVVVNVYTSNGDFAKAVRILKNQEESVTITGLKAGQRYQVRFVAVEYNEGYTNETYENNKVIHSMDISNTINATGSLKLQEIAEIEGDGDHYTATTKLNIYDPDRKLVGENSYPYYIRIEKDGEIISDKQYALNETEDLVEENTYNRYFDDVVDKGEYRYKYTLYLIVSNRELVMDTLEFTTETTAKGFSTAYEMISLIKNDNRGKYIALDDIDFYSGKNYRDNDEATGEYLTGSRFVRQFYGQLDFQGYVLKHTLTGSDNGFFEDLGAGSSFGNVVYQVQNEKTSRFWDSSCICRRNSGRIHDIKVEYYQTNELQNAYFGVLTRSNGTAGVIENFVIHNIASEESGSVGLTGTAYLSLVAAQNSGVIRYGYTYGANIQGVEVSNTTYTRAIGSIAGGNEGIGQINSVYSLVNVQVYDGVTSWGNETDNTCYGSICGYSNGALKNAYSIGENSPYEDKTNQDSPVVGKNGGKKHKNVFYWNENNRSYSGLQSKLMQLDNLYDVGWQEYYLTTNFDCDPVTLGYYPQLDWSAELPVQEYIPLPAREYSGALGISQAKVEEYFTLEDGSDAAKVRFVFSNRNNMDITGLTIEDLDVEFDFSTLSSEDGYTTVYGTVSNPQSFQSSYAITAIQYQSSGKNREFTLTTPYEMIVEFYRKISTTDDWYNYVVKKAADNDCENVRLANDIDFTGVELSKVMVNAKFTAKLDGNNHALKNIDLQKDYARTDTGANCLFVKQVTVTAEIFDLVIENYKAGGTYNRYGKYYVSRDAAVFRYLYGSLNNVHVRGVDLLSYRSVGGLVSESYEGSTIENCTVTASDSMGVSITISMPDTDSSTSSIGGLVGVCNNNTRISHCLVTDLEIEAMDIGISRGIGGVIGYASNTVIDTAYAQGTITSRVNKVGGIAGQFVSSGGGFLCAKNLYSKVDITAYVDGIGGIMGLANITSDLISEDNNVSGVAFGNLYSVNPSSVKWSHTIGESPIYNISYYGTVLQRIDGTQYFEVQPNETGCKGLLQTEAFVGSGARETYRRVIGFENVYQIGEDGTLPKMYYSEKPGKLLPYQKDIPLQEASDYELKVDRVTVDENSYLITIQLDNPNLYDITGVSIDKLSYYPVDASKENKPKYEDYSKAVVTIPDNGKSYVYVKYSENQENFQDSYLLSSITIKENGKETKIPVSARVPLTLYRKIYSVDDWNKIPTYPEYENYKLMADLDFNGFSVASNLKIGSLAADSFHTISNVTLDGKYLISNLNSEMRNIGITNSKVSGKLSTGVGFIGLSYGRIADCKFENLTITLSAKGVNYIGAICRQSGSVMENIDCKNIVINNDFDNNYVGSLAGYVGDFSEIRNITGQNLNVTGGTNVGGLFGRIYFANIDSIGVSGAVVYARNMNCGGLVGCLGGDSNAVTAKATNLSVTGLPSYNEEGVMSDSTTKITGVNGQTGAICGANYSQIGTGTENANDGALVYGCLVEGKGNYVGGVTGYCAGNTSHANIEDSLIKGDSKNSAGSEGLGGIVGRSDYGRSMNYFNVKNTRVEAYNYRYVGGSIGYMYNGAISNHCVKDSYILAETVNPETSYSVGGVVGYCMQGGNYLQAINTSIYAPTVERVGGIAGMLGNTVNSGKVLNYCYYLAETDSAKAGTYEAAAAKSDYQVVGKNFVGGMAGYAYGGVLNYGYSNANVKAAGDIGSAGGLVGYYGNEYLANPQTGAKTYSNASIRYTYFAGSVEAGTNGYAGGAIGRCGLIYTGLSGSGSRVKNVTGSYNEADRTYYNMIIPASLKGGTGKTHVFAADDGAFCGKTNFVWDGIHLYEGGSETHVLSGDLKDADGNYLYDYWIATDAVPQNNPALKLFKTTNIAPDYTLGDPKEIYYFRNGTANTGVELGRMFYRNIGWGLTYSSVATNNPNRNYRWRFSLDGVYDGLEQNETNKNVGSYLPQLRKDTTTVYKSDVFLCTQENAARLPVPVESAGVRVLSSGTSVNSLGAALKETETYGTVYASDVDKINVEFSEDLLGKGTFVLYEDEEKIYESTINQRVYTFAYDFSTKCKLVYTNENGKEETVDFHGKDLTRKVLVYKNGYYYINTDSKLISNVEEIKWPEDVSFVHLMKGKALDREGNVWNLSTGEKETRAKENLEELETAALFRFKYNDTTIETYSKCSKVLSGQSQLYREEQIFVKNNTLYTVPGDLNNQKDGILLYNLNGTSYETVLDTEGMLVDLMNVNMNLPEEIENKAISQISNTLSSDLPYVLLRYQNGGVLGYDYSTGEILFSDLKEKNVSLLEFVKDYFGTEKTSSYSGIQNTYKVNADVSGRITSTKELEEIVGYNSGELVENGVTDGAGGSNDTSGSDGVLIEEGQQEETSETKGEAGKESSEESQTSEGKSEENSSVESSEKHDVVSEDNGEAKAYDQVAVNSADFITVYNSSTGTYEIVNIDQYLKEKTYVSENVRLGEKDLALLVSGDSGYANAKVNRSDEEGAMIYVIAISIVVILLGGLILVPVFQRKRSK